MTFKDFEALQARNLTNGEESVDITEVVSNFICSRKGWVKRAEVVEHLYTRFGIDRESQSGPLDNILRRLCKQKKIAKVSKYGYYMKYV